MIVGGAASASAGVAAGGEATAAAGAYLSAKAAGNSAGGYERENSGTQTKSTTLWKSKGKGAGRIDVENPSSRRTGQIHYQEGNDKYPATNEYTKPAPNRVNRLLEKEDVERAIEKGERYLGR